MSYITKNLSELTGLIGGSGQRLWMYWTADSQATVAGAGYISDATNKRMQIGDVVWVASGTLNTTGPDQSPSTHARGTVSEFASAPSFVSYMVNAITTGAATLVATKKETITDNSGGTANAATGIVATASKQTLILPLQLADIAASETYKLAVPFAFTVNSIGFRTGKPASTASKLATLTAQVNGTPVTGGVVALTTANQNATGTLTAGTAITALNIGTAGQTVEAATSSVTAFVEGDGYIEFNVTNNDLANTIATLIAF